MKMSIANASKYKVSHLINTEQRKVQIILIKITSKVMINKWSKSLNEALFLEKNLFLYIKTPMPCKKQQVSEVFISFLQKSENLIGHRSNENAVTKNRERMLAQAEN